MSNVSKRHRQAGRRVQAAREHAIIGCVCRKQAGQRVRAACEQAILRYV